MYLLTVQIRKQPLVTLTRFEMRLVCKRWSDYGNGVAKERSISSNNSALLARQPIRRVAGLALAGTCWQTPALSDSCAELLIYRNDTIFSVFSVCCWLLKIIVQHKKTCSTIGRAILLSWPLIYRKGEKTCSRVEAGLYKKVQQSWQTSALAMHLPLARLVSMPVIFCLLPSSSI